MLCDAMLCYRLAFGAAAHESAPVRAARRAHSGSSTSYLPGSVLAVP